MFRGLETTHPRQKGGEMATTTVSLDGLRELAGFRAENGCAITLYVDLDPSVAPTTALAPAPARVYAVTFASHVVFRPATFPRGANAPTSENPQSPTNWVQPRMKAAAKRPKRDSIVMAAAPPSRATTGMAKPPRLNLRDRSSCRGAVVVLGPTVLSIAMARPPPRPPSLALDRPSLPVPHRAWDAHRTVCGRARR